MSCIPVCIDIFFLLVYHRSVYIKNHTTVHEYLIYTKINKLFSCMHGIIASRFTLFVRVINTALLFSDTFIIKFYRKVPL